MRALLAVLLIAATAMPAYAAPYPLAVRKVYLKSCNSGADAAPWQYCECTLTEMEKGWSYELFMRKMQLSEEQLLNDEQFSDFLATCSDYL